MKGAAALTLAVLMLVMPAAAAFGWTVQERPIEVWANEGYGTDTQGYGADHFSSLQEAIDSVEDGGTIYLTGASYTDQQYPLEIRNKSINIKGDGLPEIVGDGENDIIFIYGSSVSIEGCALTGGLNGVQSRNSALELKGCTIWGCSRCGVLSRGAVLSGGSLSLTSCVIYDNAFGVMCVSYPGSVESTRIINCTVCDNDASGISLIQLGRHATQERVVNCIVASNGGYGLFTLDASIQASCNDLWGNLGGNCNLRGIEGRFGNLSADPQFSQSYYPGMDSPCIDSGLDADRSLYGYVSSDVWGIQRPQGRGFDMGACESAVIRVLQLSDLHLLAPIDGGVTYGRGYNTYAWSGLDVLLDNISAQYGVMDLVVVTGDLVNWATNGMTYQTILGETYVVTEWKDTYEGYLLFKQRIVQQLGDIPIQEVVGNHDYREHPYYFWRWTDKAGIDEAFLGSMNYAGCSSVSVSELLGTDLETDIVLHLMDSGPDALGTSNVLNNTILPYLAGNASNYVLLSDALGKGMDASSLYEFTENLAYGSGFDASQIVELEGSLNAHQNDINLVFCHHPVVYPGITITRNIESFLDLCKTYGIESVLSGHTHSAAAYDVEWVTGADTLFATSGASVDGHFNIVAIQVGHYLDMSVSAG